ELIAYGCPAAGPVPLEVVALVMRNQKFISFETKCFQLG
ncbi:MAG: hypothetical protein ACI9CZ_000488, partial [Flavobacterium sp.]